MPQNKIEIIIIADGKKAAGVIKTTGEDVEKLGDATKQADTSTSGFGKSVLSLQTATAKKVPKNINPMTPNFLISLGLIKFEFISPVLIFLPGWLL